MFLKKIEMKGFKSFADKIEISFDQKITGIVGPNGCGKSNIADAIRWVLGEQSAKSLRGSAMTDVIFAGSDQRKTVNMAEVTLVFDNSQQHFNSEYQEIELTRRIYRGSGEGEYLLNKTPVRLRDIQELIMDSGLGRDTLSMISQGNISAFAEAKPAERRGLFEEAAGVAKYKKRKIESLSKLTRTQENLDRAADILYELEKQVVPLKKAAEKAKLYRQKKQRLIEIEQAVLVHEIDQLENQLAALKKQSFDLESQIVLQKTSINVSELTNDENRKELNALDKEVNSLQEQVLNIVGEIQILEKRRAEIEEKRKYVLEIGDQSAKIQSLKQLTDEAKFEYDDRLQRFNALKTEVDLANQAFSSLTLRLIDEEQTLNEGLGWLRKLNNRYEVLENITKQPYIQQQGVRSIMEAKASLPAVLGVVAEVLTPETGYEEALNVALGGSIYHLITTDEAGARQAIQFLKNNRSGRATFLPITVLKPRYLPKEHQIIAEHTSGYLGVASEFLSCEPQFDVVFDSLLGSVLVTDNLEAGNQLANLLKYQYKIVTLEGDVIHRGGSMTGGFKRESQSILTSKKEMGQVLSQIETQELTVAKLSQQLANSKREKTQLEAEILEKRISAAKLEPLVDAKRSKYEQILAEFEALNIDEPLADSEASFTDELVIKLTQAYSDRDQATGLIKTKRERRFALTKELERREQKHRSMRSDQQELQGTLNTNQIEIARLETRLEHNLNLLSSEYQSTYEFAKQQVTLTVNEELKAEVGTLRQAIADLGNINMTAPEEFIEVNERYEELKHQYDDLVLSKKQLMEAIDEMDVVMVEQFSQMFNSINEELKETFAKLFGGGKARLILENPEDILNTGIDIDVQPPGKNIQNIRLFSGGEKALIAIAVLFSILKARPIPLCIFDEVEAALDQANVERFADYVQEFSPSTQFIVVTHRPGTMAKCDVLYGVTMPMQGVSQMLQVKLIDAKEYAMERKLANGVV